jgi:hypothetical protein
VVPDDVSEAPETYALVKAHDYLAEKIEDDEGFIGGAQCAETITKDGLLLLRRRVLGLDVEVLGARR